MRRMCVQRFVHPMCFCWLLIQDTRHILYIYIYDNFFFYDKQNAAPWAVINNMNLHWTHSWCLIRSCCICIERRQPDICSTSFHTGINIKMHFWIERERERENVFSNLTWMMDKLMIFVFFLFFFCLLVCVYEFNILVYLRGMKSKYADKWERKTIQKVK